MNRVNTQEDNKMVQERAGPGRALQDRALKERVPQNPLFWLSL